MEGVLVWDPFLHMDLRSEFSSHTDFQVDSQNSLCYERKEIFRNWEQGSVPRLASPSAGSAQSLTLESRRGKKISTGFYMKYTRK